MIASTVTDPEVVVFKCHQREVAISGGVSGSGGHCLDLEIRSLLAIFVGKARGIQDRKEVEIVYPFWKVWRKMEWNGHRGGLLVRVGEGKAGAIRQEGRSWRCCGERGGDAHWGSGGLLRLEIPLMLWDWL